MLKNKSTVYVCNDEKYLEASYSIITYLENKFKSHNIINMSVDNKDFNIITSMLVEAVSERDDYYGIIISDFGIYSSMIANRRKYIRAVTCINEDMVEHAIINYDINILCIPHRLVEQPEIEKMIDKFVDMKRPVVISPKTYLIERL